MRRGLATAALALAIAVPALIVPAMASGGKTTTATGGGGGGTTTSGGGGGTTSGGGGGGGGGKTCTPSVAVNATVSPVPGVRQLTVTYTPACTSKSYETVTATNTSTGRVEWVAPTDSLFTSYTWNAPLFGTTYRIDTRVLSNDTNALLASNVTNVTTLAAPADCGPLLSSTATAGTGLTDIGVHVDYSLVWCGGPSSVTFRATNVATGQVEWAQTATGTSNQVWATPKFGTTYRIDTTAYDTMTGSVLATASNEVTTETAPPNCATITNQNESVGYWGVYAAVWISVTGKDCGYGMTSLHLKITNQSSGLVEYESYNLPMSYFMDFEGPSVKYDTDYEVVAEVRGAMNEVLDTSTQIMHTPVAP